MVTVAVMFVRPFALMWSVSEMVKVRNDEIRCLFCCLLFVDLFSMWSTLCSTWNRMLCACMANYMV